MAFENTAQLISGHSRARENEWDKDTGWRSEAYRPYSKVDHFPLFKHDTPHDEDEFIRCSQPEALWTSETWLTSIVLWGQFQQQELGQRLPQHNQDMKEGDMA